MDLSRGGRGSQCCRLRRAQQKSQDMQGTEALEPSCVSQEFGNERTVKETSGSILFKGCQALRMGPEGAGPAGSPVWKLPLPSGSSKWQLAL